MLWTHDTRAHLLTRQSRHLGSPVLDNVRNPARGLTAAPVPAMTQSVETRSREKTTHDTSSPFSSLFESNMLRSSLGQKADSHLVVYRRIDMIVCTN